MDPTYMTAGEAAAALEVSHATLYAYVSRGLIRSEAEGRSRMRRYRRDDVEALVRRKSERSDPQRVAEHALHWGAPVLDSAISLIEDGRLYYRGRDAVALSEAHTAEEVAMWLWTGEPAQPFPLSPPVITPAIASALRPPLAAMPLAEAFGAALPFAAADDLAAYDLQPGAVRAAGARILDLLCSVATGTHAEAPLAERLARAWAPERPGARHAIDGALVLSADHELNVSAFTARCVASAGATPYGAVQAGLAAMLGPKHGGHTSRVAALFAEAATPAGARRAIAERLRRGEEIPGFGHRLYPQGDPRGRALVSIAERFAPDAPGLALARALAEAVDSLWGRAPTIDFGLVTLARAFELPPGAPLALFALGRTIGWIAHAIEQYERDDLIRPRARYTGPRPQSWAAGAIIDS